jgi:hypothetical protein
MFFSEQFLFFCFQNQQAVELIGWKGIERNLQAAFGCAADLNDSPQKPPGRGIFQSIIQLGQRAGRAAL